MKRWIGTLFAMSLLIPEVAFAFCGFYVGGGGKDLFNDATMVVMMREGTKTVLSMQNDYNGPPEDFALVIPVPQVLKEANVKTLPDSVFDKIDRLAAPRLVEYWEQDPCNPYANRGMDDIMMAPRSKSSGFKKRKKKAKVRIEAQFDVAEYNIVVLSADDSTSLDTWLRDNKYNIPKNAEKYFRPYLEAGQYFFVAKVDSKKVTFDAGGTARLSPLRFHYDSGDFSLPIRLGLINSRGKQDLIVHILAKNQRYEVGNYPNVTIPTNIELNESALASFGPFYASLFDAVVEANPRAVVTEYAWQATKCDPCPTGTRGGGALNPADIATLGGDVIGSGVKPPSSGVKKRKSKKRPMAMSQGWVLTRLHARYDKKGAGKDMVFRKAKPLFGGREGDKETKTSNINQFQGRYIIRHPWKGEIACKDPKRGMWGGPPNGGNNTPTVAQNTAYIKKRKVKLASFVKGKVPRLKKK